MANFNLIYKSSTSNDLFSAFNDGTIWRGDIPISSQPGAINPQTDVTPSVVELNNILYLIYKDAGSYDICCAVHDGQVWHEGVPISQMSGTANPQSHVAPTVATFKGALYVSYVPINGYQLSVAVYDGAQWITDSAIADLPGGIDPESSVAPAMASYGGFLYLIYPGKWFSGLNLTSFDGAFWHGNIELKLQDGSNPASTRTPSLCTYKGNLYMAYTGSWSNHILLCWFDGTNWYGNNPITISGSGDQPASSSNPSIAVFGTNLMMVYRGNTFRTIYTAQFDGTTWTGNTAISSQPGGISPLTNYSPAAITTAYAPLTRKTWMGQIPDTTLISDINIPGSHDAAAINSWVRTVFATQYQTITQQLEVGIRLLDVRLKVYETGSNYRFMTCHSNYPGNEYQSFISLLDECKVFLSGQGSETIIMSLKVDDWNGTTNETAAKTALVNLLDTYPVLRNITSVPVLSVCRGKIYLVNRIDNGTNLGVPFNIPFNTSGQFASTLSGRNFQLYVQDQFKGLPWIGAEDAKTKLVTDAFTHKSDGMVVLSFASATWVGVMGVYINDELLSYFGKNPASGRPPKLGWVLFDRVNTNYSTSEYGYLDILALIIDANFNYSEYPLPFTLVGKDEL